MMTISLTKAIGPTLLLPGTLLLLTAGCATTPPAPVGDDLIQQETAVWQAARDAQADVFGSLLDPDYSGIYADGIHSRTTEIEAVRQEHLRGFALSNIVARQLDGPIRVITYKIHEQGDFGGTDFSGDYWAMSTWHLTGGQWRIITHSEVKIP